MSVKKDEVFEAGNSGLFLIGAVQTREDHRLSHVLKQLTKVSLVGRHAQVAKTDTMYVPILPDFREDLDAAGFSQDDKYELANLLAVTVVSAVDDAFPHLSKKGLHSLRVNRKSPVQAVGTDRNVVGLRFEPSAHIRTVQTAASTFLADYVDTSSWNTAGWLPVSPIAETCGAYWASQKIQNDPSGSLPATIELPNTVAFAYLATNVVGGSDATGFHIAYDGR